MYDLTHALDSVEAILSGDGFEFDDLEPIPIGCATDLLPAPVVLPDSSFSNHHRRQRSWTNNGYSSSNGLLHVSKNYSNIVSPDDVLSNIEPRPFSWNNNSNKLTNSSITGPYFQQPPQPAAVSTKPKTGLMYDDAFHRMVLQVPDAVNDGMKKSFSIQEEVATSKTAPAPQQQHSSSSNASTTLKRTRKLQSGLWQDRFDDLLQFRQQHGHLFVPNCYPPNQQLSQWVKRQRYQHKLKQMGKHSTLNNDREEILNQVGFIWDSHSSLWQQRFQDLKSFQQAHGSCAIPPNYHDSSLSLWCKHQRRQNNRARKGLSTTLTEERFQALNSIGFDWNPRGLKE